MELSACRAMNIRKSEKKQRSLNGRCDMHRETYGKCIFDYIEMQVHGSTVGKSKNTRACKTLRKVIKTTSSKWM